MIKVSSSSLQLALFILIFLYLSMKAVISNHEIKAHERELF